jgi:hypothetical protein
MEVIGFKVLSPLSAETHNVGMSGRVVYPENPTIPFSLILLRTRPRLTTGRILGLKRSKKYANDLISLQSSVKGL